MEQARAVLEAATRGKLPEALIQDLCRGVLALTPVRLATELAADGDPGFRVRRAIDLAVATIAELTDVEDLYDGADTADTADTVS